MAWVRTIVSEFLGLFVDDVVFAGSILAWLAVTWLLGRAGVPSMWQAIVLACGLIAILVGSAISRTGHRQG